jgi:hypothetical protein
MAPRAKTAATLRRDVILGTATIAATFLGFPPDHSVAQADPLADGALGFPVDHKLSRSAYTMPGPRR